MASTAGDLDDDYQENALLTLIGVRTKKNPRVEEKIAKSLNIDAEKVVVVEVEEQNDNTSTVMFAILPGKCPSAAELADSMNAFIKKNPAVDWLQTDMAHCAVTDQEEEVEIDEATAFQLWKNMPTESRTSHLMPVSSPDGETIQPVHLTSTNKIGDENSTCFSSTKRQLERDPSLLEFDNVERVDISRISNVSWELPVIITGCCGAETRGVLFQRENLLKQYNRIEVRTGNRNTLIESGFDNSLPMELGRAIENEEDCGQESSCIVFSPIKELPPSFQDEIQPILSSFPSFPENQAQLVEHNRDEKRCTICIAGRQGFGIGMHKHNQALFMLLEGRKKWYMAPSNSLDVNQTTHPGFYTQNSSHKCIQQPGEVLYVPDQWYHEIFNLEYTAGIQALPN